jgi:predicted permease
LHPEDFFMTGFFEELRFAARGMIKNPGVTLLAVITLALGIGMNTLMFGIVYGALYRGLPFPDGDRIVHIWTTNPSQGIEQGGTSIHDYVDWVEEQTTIEDLAAGYQGTINVSGLDRPIRFDGAFITANGFESLGMEPVIGRAFVEGEDEPDAPHVAILGYRVWQDRFGGSSEVLDRTLRVNGQPTSIIGVMPEGFMFPENQEIWVPLRLDPVALERGSGQSLNVWGKLKPGVELETAAAEFEGIGVRLQEAYPETNEGASPWVQFYTDAFMGGEAETIFLTMLATTLLVLVVACTNVANLLLARAAGRTKELAITVALGANRYRVMWKLVAEAAVLVVVGALIGFGLAEMGMEIVLAMATTEPPPFWFDFSFDAPILFFVISASGFSALFAGLVPGFRVTATKVHDILKDESRGSSSLRIGRLSRFLVITELAFSVGLLVVAGLQVKGMLNLRSLEYPFRTEEVFTARVGLFESDFPTPAERWEFYREVRDRLSSRPEVRTATVTSVLPGLWGEGASIGIQGATYQDDQDFPFVRFAAIGPGFFETMGVEVLRGRAITAQDEPGTEPVALVNQSFALRFFQGEDPIGRQIRIGRSDSQEPWLTIVGLVPDMYLEGVGNNEDSPAGFYVPLAHADRRFVSIAAVGSGDPSRLLGVIQEVVSSVHTDTPLYWTRTLRQSIKENVWTVDLFGGLFAVFGILALVLAAAGLYAVMSMGVSQRTREVGVRMALGAKGRDVLGMILRQGGVQLGIGLATGFLLAAALSRGLSGMLFGVEPWDPGVFLAIAAIMVLTGLAASFFPAHRATRVDPVEALRSE